MSKISEPCVYINSKFLLLFPSFSLKILCKISERFFGFFYLCLSEMNAFVFMFSLLNGLNLVLVKFLNWIARLNTSLSTMLWIIEKNEILSKNTLKIELNSRGRFRNQCCSAVLSAMNLDYFQLKLSWITYKLLDLFLCSKNYCLVNCLNKKPFIYKYFHNFGKGFIEYLFWKNHF